MPTSAQKLLLAGLGRAGGTIFRSAADRLQQMSAGLSTSQGVFASATLVTFRVRRVVPAGLYSGIGPLALEFTDDNWYTSSSPSVAEYNGPNAITVSRSIEYNTNAALRQWNPNDAGARYAVTDLTTAAPAVIASGGRRTSTGVFTPSGSTVVFYEVVAVSTSVAGFPCGLTLQPAGTNFDQYAVGTDLSAGSPTGWTNGAPSGYTATRIRAKNVSATKGLLAVGNSLAKGTGNNPSDASWVDIFCGWSVGASSAAMTVPLQKYAQGGDAAQTWLTGSTLRQAEIAAGYAAGEYTCLLIELGSNDLATLGRTDVQLEGDIVSIINKYPRLPAIFSTIAPRNLTTLGNPPNANFVAYKNSVNAWSYTQVGTRFAKIFDVCAVVENTPGSSTGTGDNQWKDIRFCVNDFIHFSGGAVGSGSAGVQGTTSAGGGHATVASQFTAADVL